MAAQPWFETALKKRLLTMRFPVDPMKIYLAGLDVFLPDAIDAGQRKVELSVEACVRLAAHSAASTARAPG
jgi:hypothetical protein